MWPGQSLFQTRKAEAQNQGLIPGTPKCRASPPGCCASGFLPCSLNLSGRAQLTQGPSPGTPQKKASIGPSSLRAPSLVLSSKPASPAVGLHPFRSCRGDNGGVCGGGEGAGPPARCPLSSRLLPSSDRGGWEAPLAGFLLPFLC